MENWSTRPSEAGDYERFSSFFDRFDSFNPYNQPPDPGYKSLNMMQRVVHRSSDHLVFYRKQPVVFLRYHQHREGYIMECLIFDDGVGAPINELKDFLREEIYKKISTEDPVRSISYVTFDVPESHDFLTHLGFYEHKNHRLMELANNRYKKNEWNPSIDFIVVQGSQDLEVRTAVQNEIFHRPGRVPLQLADVQMEVKSKTYLPALSLLLYYEKRPVGYGQIVRNIDQDFLVNFGIIPSFRGKGLSKILLRELLNRSAKEDIREIALIVDDDNKVAITLYESMGFEAVGNEIHWRLDLTR